MSDGGAPRPERALRTASLGISTAAICGVRDHAALLSAALEREGCTISTHWLDRSDDSLSEARTQVAAWTRGLPGELASARADAALLHYSVFSYSFRGLPLFTHPVLAAVRHAHVPLVTILHEFVYPWGRDGLRGTAWALSQRALLIEVMGASDAVVATTDFQAEWLTSRPWLARRPVAVAPVFSNLPEPVAAAPAAGNTATIGLFGYAYPQPSVFLIVDALRRLQDGGTDARLHLLGAPGRSSSAGGMWLAAARAAGLTHAPSFSGTLRAQQLSDALGACDLLLFADPIGPNSRKTTLAASLASGRPVVAVDGPRRFGELVDARAAEIVAPRSQAIAETLVALLRDDSRREELAARGRAFAAQNMSSQRAARTTAGLLRDVAA